MSLNPITHFPLEINYKIFFYLTPQDLAVCSRVSKEWNQFLKGNPTIWRESVKEIAAEIKIDMADPLSYLKQHSIPFSKISASFEQFLDKLHHSQRVSWKCQFYYTQASFFVKIDRSLPPKVSHSGIAEKQISFYKPSKINGLKSVTEESCGPLVAQGKDGFLYNFNFRYTIEMKTCCDEDKKLSQLVTEKFMKFMETDQEPYIQQLRHSYDAQNKM